MARKIYILSSKTDNMRIVLENMVYGADATRPEQRGILAVSEGDLIFLYDINKRMIIGPFYAVSDVYYAKLDLWPDKKWDFIVPLDTLIAKIGVVKGRKLLDLIVETGKLSLRDRATLDTYWINTILASEAELFIEKFYELAVFYNMREFLQDYYKIERSSGVFSLPDGKEGISIASFICNEIKRKRHLPEWILEASLVAVYNPAMRLVGDPNAIKATGVYLYSGKFLDVVYLTHDSFNAIIEVKNNINKRVLNQAMDQVAYYAYSMSKGLNLPSHKLIMAIVFSEKSSTRLERIEEEFKRLKVMKAEVYGLRSDLFVLARINLACSGDVVNPDLEVIG